MPILRDTTTLNEYLAACGNCPFPTTPAPVITSQSISLAACGYSLPAHEDIEPENACKLFRFKKSDQTLTFNFDPTPPSGYNSYTQSDVEVRSTTRKKYNDGEDCLDTISASSFLDTASVYATNGSDEVVIDSTTIVDVSSSGGACSGTITVTDGVTPENNYSDPVTEGCPDIEYDPDGTWSYAALVYTFSGTDSTSSFTNSVTFSDPITVEILMEDIQLLIEGMGAEDPWPGTSSTSSLAVTEVMSEPEGEDPPPPEIVCSQITGITLSRYQFCIPNTDEYANYETAHAAYLVAKAAWLAADPEERGPEPVEPFKRSTYICQAQEYFFSEAWDAWDILHGAFQDATAAYAAWELEDPETRGPAPIIPDDPGPAPTPLPELVATRTWTWSGSLEAPCSPFYQLEIPAAATVAGTTRRVNLNTTGSQTRYGRKPTFHGEIYDPA